MKRHKRSTLGMVRIVLAIASVVLMTTLFASGAGRGEFAFLAKAQFIPALLAGNVVVLALLLLFTFLFGRLYCSVICPLGITQDFVNWLTIKTGGKKKAARFGYSQPKNILRYSLLTVYAVALVFGIGSFMAILDPYAAFGRIITHIFTPVSVMLNNLIASSTGLLVTETYVGLNSLALSVAIVTFVAVSFLAVRGGRTYCNTICPVGSLLGLVSRFSLFRVEIDTDKCGGCGLCGKKCRASCIDTVNHSVDYSRCVDCMDCVSNCAQGAVSYTFKKDKVKMEDNSKLEDESRRKFLSTLFLTSVAGSKLWAREKVGQVEQAVGVARSEDKAVPVSPFGSISHKHLNSKCTACHLCIDKCPQRVIRPSVGEYGIEGLMQPVMDYEKGFCDYDCNICSQVCPAGAIRPLTVDEKHSIRVGVAEFNINDCILSHGALLCGACLRACPADAIRLKADYNQPLSEEEIKDLDNLPQESGRPGIHFRMYPQVDSDMCIGCGACQYRCPTKAMKVIGFEVHK